MAENLDCLPLDVFTTILDFLDFPSVVKFQQTSKSMSLLGIQLTTLDISTFPHVSDQEFCVLTKRFPNVCRINVRGCQGIYESLFEGLLTTWENILAIDISETSLSQEEEPCSVILQLLSPSCHHISLSRSGDFCLLSRTLLEDIITFSQLKSLHLAGCSNVVDSWLVELSRCCPLLQEIDLSGCVSLVRPTISLCYLEYLDMSRCNNLQSLRLSLSDDCLSNQESFQNSCSTKGVSIDLSSCSSFNDLGLEELLGMVIESEEQINKSSEQCCSPAPIISLNLSNCLSLRRPNIHSSTLQSLNFSLCSSLQSPILCCPSLIKLNLSICVSLSDPHFFCPQLSKLNLSFLVSLERPSFRQCSSLKELNMQGCPHMNQGKIKNIIPDILKECPSLTEENIKYDVNGVYGDIDDDMLEQLRDAIVMITDN